MSATTRPTILCDVAALGRPDLGTVGALARLALEARELGFELRLVGAAGELRELIDFAGLEQVLLGVEPGRQAEQREQPLGVEEERQLADGAA